MDGTGYNGDVWIKMVWKKKENHTRKGEVWTSFSICSSFSPRIS